MLEWQVGEEPPPTEEGAPHRRGPPRRWGLWLSLVLLVAVVAGALLMQRWRTNDAFLRAALESVVGNEDRLMRLGTASDTEGLVDPTAPDAWQQCYAALFGSVERDAPTPQIARVEQRGLWARVTLQYPGERLPDETRIYYLYDQEWQRSPLSASPWAEFALVPGPFELRNEGPTFALSPELPAWHAHLLQRWPEVTCPDCQLQLVVLPAPTAPEILHVEQPTLCLNDPAFAQGESASPLSAEQRATLGQLRGVMMALTEPPRVDYPPLDEQRRSPLTSSPEDDWLALLMLLQEAETHTWGLDEGSARALRNSWREELDYQWVDPFDDALPFYPGRTTAEVRARYLMLRLLVAWRTNVPQDREDAGAVLLGRILYGFEPDRFDLEGYFTALIGGSAFDLENLYDDYIATPE